MAARHQVIQTEVSAKEVVLSFIQALNDNDFDGARSHVDDALLFQGVMGTRTSADDYFRDMKKMKFKYAVQKVFESGDDVCLWYDITMGEREIFSAGWYKVEDGKIISFKVLFDPRPLLEQAKN